MKGIVIDIALVRKAALTYNFGFFKLDVLAELDKLTEAEAERILELVRTRISVK